ncbi:MAG: OadG family protein [Clostridia bacterium]
MEMLQVVLMGFCTVFICLVCLIAICKTMSAVISKFAPEKTVAVAQAVATPATQTVMATPNKQQLVAAIGVAIAEDLGTDISHIRIHSIKKI